MAIRSRLANVAITVDTTSAEVAEAALAAGADAINDISAGLDDEGMLALSAAWGAGLVLMHRLVRPKLDRYSDQYESGPVYADVVADVRAFLAERAGAAQAAGVPAERIVLDPGMGFGKTVEQNLLLLKGTGAIASLGHPVLSGISRKSFVGRVSLGRDSQPEERLSGSLALSVLHYQSGARVFRVHDVPEHMAALSAAASVVPLA
jgi:dihydropteroate synthase